MKTPFRLRTLCFFVITTALFLTGQGNTQIIGKGLSSVPRAKSTQGKYKQRDRKEAKIEAIRDACEQLRVTITSDTKVKNFVVIYDQVEAEANEKLKFQTIHDEYNADGLYEIKILATKATDEVTETKEQIKNIEPIAEKPKEPEIREAPSKKLTIHVVQAYNILNMDALSASDPWVSVTINGEQVGRTPTVQDNPNPVWNQSFFVPIYNGGSIRFDVYDNDVTKSDWVGVVVCQSPQSGTYDIRKQGVAGSLGQLKVTFEQ
jgi:hypothetical protein